MDQTELSSNLMVELLLEEMQQEINPLPLLLVLNSMVDHIQAILEYHLVLVQVVRLLLLLLLWVVIIMQVLKMVQTLEHI